MPQELLAHYPPDVQRHDEVFASAGVAREPYAALLKQLIGQGPQQLRAMFGEVDRQIRDNGVTYNVYGDARGADRPWNLDPLPLILSAQEWRGIEAAVIQRATLLDRVLADLYGAQQLLHERRLPPSLILGHPGFLRPLAGITPPGDAFLHFYAADLVRSPDGQWWVIGDRTQSPSGAGYALENRLIVSRLFPDLFRDLQVRRLAGFFAARRDSLEARAPRSAGEPCRIVLLTPGPYNETYFEHAYLARYLGYPLVEGQDLTVREGCVWLKTLSGLQRVHAIIRRQDDDYCDPLELRSDSALGVPGLVEAIRRGNVLVANSLGVSLLESGALNGFLPGLCEHLLGEPLAMPNAATWWCGEEAAMNDALEQAAHLVFKGATPQRPFGPVFGEDLDEAGIAHLAARVRANPGDFVAQEPVMLSRAPVLDRERQGLLPRSVGLRVFAAWTPQGFIVMPGGLARTSAQDDARLLSSQYGGGSKDVWVCGEEPPTQLSLLHRPVHGSDLVRTGANLSSRVVENLFWFGRYSERCDSLARYLRVALTSVVEDNVSAATRSVLLPGIRLGLLDAGITPPHAPRALVRAIIDPDVAGGLGSHVLHLTRVGFNLRERLSGDNWRTLNSLAQRVARKPADQTGVYEALALLDELINRFMTLSGFALDGMTRDHGWRFMSLGRRIERLQFQTRVIESALDSGNAASLEWLLEVSDSIVTYRSRYLSQPEWLATLDLLMLDESNPRGLLFQTAGLVNYLDALGELLGDMPGQHMLAAHQRLGALDAEAVLQPDSEALRAMLDELRTAAARLSDELSLRFFSHVRSTQV